MKLDTNRPYAQIWGHAAASYEQGGILFDGSGEAVEENAKEINEETAENEDALVVARELLTSALSGGAVSKGGVFKAAEDAHVAWADVMSMAAAMNVRKYKQGRAEMWKLV